VIGIIILNYCSYSDVRDCINSIKNNKVRDYKIFIVDNASPDKSGAKLKDIYNNDNNVEVIFNDKNSGYSSGNNIGIKKAIDSNCEFIIITNPDILFQEGSIYKMVKFFSKADNIGMVGPKIYNHNMTVYRYGQRKKRTELKELYFLKYPLSPLNIGNVKNGMFYTDIELNSSKLVYTLSGCCFCLSNHAAKELYPLDEGTFMYLEETIIGYKLEKKGLKVQYIPESEVIHNHPTDKTILSPFNLMHKLMSELYYCKKYLKCSRIAVIPIILYYYIVYLYGCFSLKSYRNFFKAFIKTTTKKLNFRGLKQEGKY
jgi:GT2 family glycosyltransferase